MRDRKPMKRKEARPILVLRVPLNYTSEQIDGIAKVAHEVVGTEYFTFILHDKLAKSIKFETYNVADAPLILLKQLKKELKSIKQY